MAKYIIEFEEEPSMVEAGLRYYQCKQVPYWGVSHGIIKNLTPYTEPDRNVIENEVWKLAQEMDKMDADEFADCFNKPWHSTGPSSFTYYEAKAKYDTWKKQKEEIHIGDEVKLYGTKYVVFRKLYISNVLYMEGLNSKRQTYMFTSDQVTKTGRHFDEVERLLERMKAE